MTVYVKFMYLVEANVLTFLAPFGIETETEPSVKDQVNLIRHIKTNVAAALFVFNLTSYLWIAKLAS